MAGLVVIGPADRHGPGWAQGPIPVITGSARSELSQFRRVRAGSDCRPPNDLPGKGGWIQILRNLETEVTLPSVPVTTPPTTSQRPCSVVSGRRVNSSRAAPRELPM